MLIEFANKLSSCIRVTPTLTLHTRSHIAFVLPTVAFGILKCFLGIYYKLEDPIHRIVVWLAYKVFSFGTINIFAKISRYKT